MKLLLGAKKYLEQQEEAKKKAMEPPPPVEDHDDEFTIPEQKTLQMKLLAGVVLHPIDYAKHLMMMGYEPLPPVQTTWFGRTYYTYPNVLKYVGHIYSVDGVLGLFRGIAFKGSSIVLQNSLINYLDRKYPAPQIGDSLVEKLKRNITVKCICTLTSHPLQLIAARCMAQFVGREKLYSEWNPLANFLRIFKAEGLLGIFKGFWARLIGEIALVTTSVVIVHAIYKVARAYSDESETAETTEKSMVIYSGIVNFVCVSYFYPYNVVATTMSVNGVGLKVGQPPISPVYGTSLECYQYLSHMNQVKRGSNLFYRWLPTGIYANEGLKAKYI